MRTIDLDQLNNEIQHFMNEREWDQFHTLKNLVCALSVESSELLEIFQWLKDEDANRIMQDENLRTKVEDEVADIFVYLLRIMNKTGIDLETVVKEKMRKNALKYPVELARGNSKKYTEL